MLEPVQKIAKHWGAKVKIVEVPPGPPVMSPIVAEIYGPDYDGARKVAGKVREQFGKTEGIVAIDDTVTEAAPKLLLHVLQSKAALLGVAPGDIVDVISVALSGQDVASLHDVSGNTRRRCASGCLPNAAAVSMKCSNSRCARAMACWCRFPKWCR